jgi:hypothetical protein
LIKGFVDRTPEFGEIVNKRPKIIFKEIVPLIQNDNSTSLFDQLPNLEEES